MGWSGGGLGALGCGRNVQGALAPAVVDLCVLPAWRVQGASGTLARLCRKGRGTLDVSCCRRHPGSTGQVCRGHWTCSSHPGRYALPGAGTLVAGKEPWQDRGRRQGGPWTGPGHPGGRGGGGARPGRAPWTKDGGGGTLAGGGTLDVCAGGGTLAGGEHIRCRPAASLLALHISCSRLGTDVRESTPAAISQEAAPRRFSDGQGPQTPCPPGTSRAAGDAAARYLS